MPGTNRQPRSIQHICSDAGTEFCSDTLENGAVRTKFISIQQLPNIKNKMALLKDTGGPLQNLLILFFCMQDSIGSSFNSMVPERGKCCLFGNKNCMCQ